MNRINNTLTMLDRILENNLSVIYNKDYHVEELDDKTTLEMPVPGFTKEDITIETIDGVLIIDGANEDSRWTEDFTKKFRMPNSLDPSKVDATIENGILKVTFERRPESQSKKIKIK